MPSGENPSRSATVRIATFAGTVGMWTRVAPSCANNHPSSSCTASVP